MTSPTKGTEFRFYLVIKTCEAHALLRLYSQCKTAINNITGNMILILHGGMVDTKIRQKLNWLLLGNQICGIFLSVVIC